MFYSQTIILTNSMAYGTQKFNAAFTRGSPIIPILSKINQIPRVDTYFFKVHSNIVLPSTPRPSILRGIKKYILFPPIAPKLPIKIKQAHMVNVMLETKSESV